MIKTFSGGIHPDASKEPTVDKRISPAPLPKRVSIPLLQNTGNPAKVQVKAGDTLLKGQLIGDAESFISSRVHASISGKVIAVEEYINPIYGKTECVFIESDGKDAPYPYKAAPKAIKDLSREDIIDIIKDAGIVGLGGGAFPTHVKLIAAEKKEKYSLIINGAECEPYLTSDHRLMIEKTQEILKGVELLAKASNAENVYIAIEENKLSAIFAMERAIERLTTKIVRLKTKYPQGGEKQLIKAVLNREVPPGKLPLHVGCVVQNVATAYAVYEAVIEGKPLIERCVTLTGSCLRKPGNFLIRIGSILGDVVEECCSGFIRKCSKIILGGPMMGVAHYSLDIPIIKGINGVVFLSEEETEVSEESPCIRCSKCVDVCPVNLIPTDIARAVKKQKKPFLEELNVFDCIECGACSFACPARVPLVQYIKLAKAQMQEK